MGSTCFLTNTLDRVNSEISLRVLALNSVMVVHTAKTDKLIGDETVSSLTRWLNVLSDLQSGKVCPVNTFMPMLWFHRNAVSSGLLQRVPAPAALVNPFTQLTNIDNLCSCCHILSKTH